MKSKKSESKYKTSNKGHLLIMSGPSGAGKGTVVCELLRRMPEIMLSVSATTRKPRNGEVDGVSYFFINEEEFLSMISNGEFLEYDRHFENYYGTPVKYVFENLEQGKDVLLEIDIAGAKQVKEKYPEAKLFFIDAPSIDELKRRLVCRNSESQNQLDERLLRVEEEMKCRQIYDYVVINDTVDNAVNKIIQIIKEMKINDNKTAD
ncbi:MAG TPA: guanylate kinase [Eubacteriales bacterium]|nr:guanylate kinase [Eubacteriales bacterium]